MKDPCANLSRRTTPTDVPDKIGGSTQREPVRQIILCGIRFRRVTGRVLGFLSFVSFNKIK